MADSPELKRPRYEYLDVDHQMLHANLEMLLAMDPKYMKNFSACVELCDTVEPTLRDPYILITRGMADVKSDQAYYSIYTVCPGDDRDKQLKHLDHHLILRGGQFKRVGGMATRTVEHVPLDDDELYGLNSWLSCPDFTLRPAELIKDKQQRMMNTATRLGRSIRGFQIGRKDRKG